MGTCTCCTLACLVVVLGLLGGEVSAYFGEPILHGFDNRFDDMGEVRVDTFNIANGSVVLTIAIENTQNQDELWMVDFQPYNYDLSKPPVISTDGGKLVAAHTGNCSNVFQDVPFDAVNGFYDDEYMPVAFDGKDLFNSMTAGAAGFVARADGLVVRTELLSFTGNIDQFFDCVDSHGKTVWERHVYDESIEFNTTLYVTNVRPKKTDDGESGISFIQSHVILYWRLLRTAIARFIISSTERITPIFEYAIVRPVYVDDDETKGPDRNKAEVELAFKTVTGSDTIMAVYDDTSFDYIPIDTDNNLNYVKDDPEEVTVYYNPTDETANVIIDGVTVPVCPADVANTATIANTMCAEFGLTAVVSSNDAAETSSNALVGVACTDSVQDFGECTYTIGTSADCFSGAVSVTCAPIETAKLPKSCHDYLQAAKREGIELSDGFYDIDVAGTRTTVYCDMTRDGGGWTLIVTTTGPDGFTPSNLLSNNPDSPSTADDYSILGLADDIRSTSDGDNFRYRIESDAPGENGGIWEAPITHSFVGGTDTATTTLVEKFGVWEENLPDGGGPQNVMPFILPGEDNMLTTGGADKFGAVACSCLGTPYNPAPWIDGVPQPETIWYWVKEDKAEPTTNTVHTSTYEEPMLAPTCDFTEYPGKCTQRWSYTVVLNVDDTGIDADKPIDATGEFEVGYYTYNCPDLTTGQTDNCELVDVPIAFIGTEVTLQSTVQIIDATKDKPIVLLKRLYGTDPSVDLRDGARGVQHLEQVTVDTHFFPEFVREHMEMKLTLFMVCVGDAPRDDPDGCINSPDIDRYVAYVSPDFYYKTLVDHADESQGYLEYFTDDFTHLLTQQLDSNKYIHNEDIHQSKFTNKALSDSARKYTITNVFLLINRNEPEPTTAAPLPLRRKRDDEVFIVSHELVRRDMEESAALPQVHSIVLESAGCPDNSKHDAENLHCLCLDDKEEYSAETFKCEPKETLHEKTPTDEGSAAPEISTNVYGIIFSILISIYILS